MWLLGIELRTFGTTVFLTSEPCLQPPHYDIFIHVLFITFTPLPFLAPFQLLLIIYLIYLSICLSGCLSVYILIYLRQDLTMHVCRPGWLGNYRDLTASASLVQRHKPQHRTCFYVYLFLNLSHITPQDWPQICYVSEVDLEPAYGLRVLGLQACITMLGLCSAGH